MKVGIPSEISPNELRVAATPKTVKRLQKQGFEVYIQQVGLVKSKFL
jgi:NAD(P) transhydrogenase subunit alpha